MINPNIFLALALLLTSAFIVFYAVADCVPFIKHIAKGSVTATTPS